MQDQRVTLASSSGPIERILVKDLGEIVLITREEEYQAAQIEGREPVTIGFPKKDVLS